MGNPYGQPMANGIPVQMEQVFMQVPNDQSSYIEPTPKIKDPKV